MTKFLKNADVTGYISQTSVTSSLVKTDADGKLVAAVAGTDYNAPGVTASAGTLIREIRNTTGATLTKGTIVYISGATGNKPTVSKALATGDSTSAQTFGMCQTNIANNSNGNVVVIGDITGVDTSAFTEGAQLYLSSTTAGTYTTTKQLAPNHLVYIGVVTRAHPTQGQIEVKIQNGYELDEIHDVAISSLANNQGLFYESATDLWKNKTIATVLGYTPADDAAVVKLTGNQTVAGVKTFTASLLTNNPSEGATGEGLIAGRSFKIDATATGQRAEMYVVSDILSNIYGSGLTAQYANFAGDKAFGFNLNTVGGFELYVKNTSWNKALTIANTKAATFTDTVAATSFIKTGGTSAQFLKADGSVDSSTYLTSYTETDTLATVTGRGATTNTQISISASTLQHLVLADRFHLIGGSNFHLTNNAYYSSAFKYKTANQVNKLTLQSDGTFLFDYAASGTIDNNITWTTLFSISNTGTATASSFVRSGGTAAQFLKADGSVDSSTYVSSSALASYLPLSGGTLTGAVSGTRLSLLQNSADATLSAANLGTGRAFSVLGTSYFSADIQLGFATNAILKTTALGVITSAIAGTDYVVPSGTTTGNVASRGQSNWNDATVIGNVVGMLAWKNYGNGHVIFDASNGTSPSGTAVNATNSAVAWSSSYPTLMGWNGASTYGVRVDSARYADSAGSATDSTKLPLAGGTMTGSITMASSGTSYVRMGRFPNSVTNTEEAWIGRAADRNIGTMTVQLGGGSVTDRRFEVVDYAWSTVLFNVNSDGNVFASTSMRAPIFYDSNDTGYYGNFASTSSLWGLAIRGDNGASSTDNQIFFWGAGNTTTSAIGFKSNAGYFTNPTGFGDGYNTYLTMDSDGRGWVFRRGVGGTDFGAAYTSGWILNNGIWQANSQMRAPVFKFTNSTNNAYLTGNSDWGFRAVNDSGYIQFGPANTSWTHIYSDKSFYFNQELYVNGTQVVKNSGTWAINITGSAGSASSSTTAAYLPTYYAGGQQTNPQVYFSQSIGLRVAMTGAWSVWSDTLWINGYAGGDVLQMCALHTLRNGTPRMAISVQASNSSSYGTFYEFITTYNIANQTVANTNSISSATGNNYNWTGLNYFVSNRNTSTDSAPLQAYSNNGGGAIMSFHRGGYYAVNFGLDSDNVMRIGGWSAGVNRWQLDMSGNQTVAGNVTAGVDVYSNNGWFYSYNNTGWYNNSYGQGIRPAKANVNYGSIITLGENFNGYGGYAITNTYNTIFMQNSGGDHGFFRDGGGGGWSFFYHQNYNCAGIGTDATDPSYSLHIIKYGGSNTGWIIWSDRRIKENIKTIDNALDKVLALRGVYYNKIDDPNKERCVGYIAQEVMEVVPELVVYSEELDMYNMNYAPMVGMLTEAMKEQQAQIEELKQQVQTLLNS
jgi:hypothetical protein